jgi:hypothetical protein
MTGVPKGMPWKKQSAKPCFIACFIYSYARRCLYDMLPWAYYCDTDSALMKEEDVKEFMEQRPHRFPPDGEQPEFGHVAEELTEKGISANYRAYLIQPKTYAVFAYDEKGNYAYDEKDGKRIGRSKIRAKGVKKSDIVLGEAEAKKLDTELRSPQERFFYTGENKENAFGEEANAERLYAVMKRDGRGYVLCSQIVRSMTKEGKPFVLTQRYTVKKLTVEQ